MTMTIDERKETISALRQLLAMCDFVDQYGDSIDADPYFDAVETAIESLNENEWIPVSERLPEISGLYLVSTDRYGVWSARATMFDAGTNSWAKKGDKRATINAWMPLPEPYKEDGEA